MESIEFQVETIADLTPVAQHVLAQPAHQTAATVMTLTGDLGAGKTTFVQQLGKQLGITDHITSPTFGIMKGYELLDQPDFDQFIHIDAYRIEDESEIGPLRLGDVFASPRTLVCVEWPERIASVLPSERTAIQIEIMAEETRRVVVTR